jgi:hypothetical protein
MTAATMAPAKVLFGFSLVYLASLFSVRCWLRRWFPGLAW